jgi:hypothetical protein
VAVRRGQAEGAVQRPIREGARKEVHGNGHVPVRDGRRGRAHGACGPGGWVHFMALEGCTEEEPANARSVRWQNVNGLRRVGG